MNLFSAISQRTGIVFLLISIALIIYFAFHAIEGKHGLKARSELQWRVDNFERKLAELKSNRQELERDVSFIRYDIDPDLLDEQARRLLNMVTPEDIVIMLNKQGS